MRRDVTLPLVCVLLLLASAGGCSSGSEPFATDPGASVLVGSATEVAIESLGGGFAGPPPVGAGCDPQKLRDDVVFASGVLSWTKCQVSGSGTNASDYAPASGSRTLTPTELSDLRGAIGAVRVSGRTSCGADKPELTLTVFEASAQQVYGDDFYACAKTYSAFVTSETLDPLFAAFTQLVGP